jgi:multiple sugar transport system permease protein
MAAYSFARLRFPGRDQIFFLYLGTMMIPHAVTMIPSFVLMRYLGWMDTWRAIIIPGMGSAFGTFLMRQFFLSIPNELEDAARIDGAGRARVFVQILIPLAVPALVTLTIFGFRSRWNEFLWPLLVLSTKEKFPIQVGLSAFRYEFGTLTHLMMTGAAMSVLPLMILFMAAQKYFVRGVVLSGIKG